MKKPVDVSVIVNAHREGLIVTPTLKSLERARSYAENCGRTVEIIICLDKGDALTRATLQANAPKDAIFLEVGFGDLGESRNHSVKKSEGNFIAFLDADDMFGETWIERACDAARRDPRAIVWHPELNLYFADADHIYRHIDMESPEFEMTWLADSNPWTALCFADREVFENFPYPKTDLAAGVGYEDWGWARLVIDAGYIHKIVPRTAHAIRRKPFSLVKQTTAAGVLPLGTNMFRNILERRKSKNSIRSKISPQLT